MFIRQLVYLNALSQERHFARAAARCNVSQPTLSAGLRGLEDELGVPIIQRGHRFMGFTPEGQRVLAWAQRILADFDGLRQDLGELKGDIEGSLRLGVVPSALPMAAALTNPLLERHPRIRVEVHSLPSRSIEQGLDRFELDAGVTYLDNEPLRNVRSVALYTERYVLLTARAGPLGQRVEASWAEAAGLPLCLLAQTMQHRRIIDQVLAEAGAVAGARVEADTHLALMGYVRSGWSSIFPHAHGQLVAVGQDTVSLPLVTPERTHEIGLVYPDREPVQPIVGALVAVLRKVGPIGLP